MKKIKFILLSLLLSSFSTILNSCVNNDDESIKSPTRYTANDIQSYSDLFEVFWQTMDQRYNYFYEQKRADGLDWSDIHEKYSPKFKELKTYGRSTESNKDILDDYEKALQYFKEIIDPIIDVHFRVTIQFPVTNKDVFSMETIFGGIFSKKKHNTSNLESRYNYIKSRMLSDSFLYDYKNEVNSFRALGGFLQSNPDIYYFSFPNFSLTQNLKITLDDQYLNPGDGNGFLLTANDIDSNEKFNSIKDEIERKKVKDFTLNVLNEWNKFPTSTEVKAFNNEVKKFKESEIVSDEFVTIAKNALEKSNNLINYTSLDLYSSVINDENLPYIKWFIQKMNEHVTYGYYLPRFQNAANSVITRSTFYQKFLNPLHKGNIKKLILDLRGNGGGNVLDARFFSDRFITKSEIFSYQRSKEGNGRYNYTPWVPVKTYPHRFGIPNNIPIVILTDKGSASMSEMTTLMLRSQGSQVISIGDYSAGATAGLGTPDDFNGGTRDYIAGGKLEFYMPLLALKDAEGEVIEGVGIKPNIYVSPFTDEELASMKSAPSTFVDRVLDKATEYLSSK